MKELKLLIFICVIASRSHSIAFGQLFEINVDYKYADAYSVLFNEKDHILLNYYNDYLNKFHIEVVKSSDTNEKFLVEDVKLTKFLPLGSTTIDDNFYLYHLSGNKSLPVISLYKISQTNSTYNLSIVDLLELDQKREKIITSGIFGEQFGILTADTNAKTNSVNFYLFEDGENWSVFKYDLKGATIFKALINNPVYSFTEKSRISTCEEGNSKVKLFYEDQSLIFVLDEFEYKEGTTHVEKWDVKLGTFSSFNIDNSTKYRSPRSFYYHGNLYRLFINKEDVNIDIFNIESSDLVGNYRLSNNESFPRNVKFVYKHLKSKLLSIEDRTTFRALGRGETSIFINPNKNEGIQLGIGSYYVNPMGVSGGASPFGLLFFFATTAIKNMNKIEGVEKYYTINFNDSLLKSINKESSPSNLNLLDSMINIKLDEKAKYKSYTISKTELFFLSIPKRSDKLIIEKIN